MLISPGSANVMLDGLTKSYHLNAFSIIISAITDDCTAIRDNTHATRIKRLTRWGMSSQSEHITLQLLLYFNDISL